MLAFFRKLSQSWVSKIFFAVLIGSFVVWGVKDAFHPKLTTAVVSAGSHTLEPADFKRLFENYRKQSMQQTGEMISVKDAVANGVDQRLLDGAATDEAFAEFVKRLGLAPSDQLMIDILKKQPMFFDRVSGKFDEQAYRQTLADNNLTPERYEAALRDDIAQNQLVAGLAAGLKQPLAYGALEANFELENRTFSFFLLDPKSVGMPTPPTDAELQAFIKQNADQLRRPEMRALTVVRFSAKSIAPTLTPAEADILKIYNFRKDSLSAPERRTLVEIPARDAQGAASIAARLRAGEAPDAIAKAFGVQPIHYADVPMSGVADAKVGAAAFRLAAGGVSDPVQTSLAGLAVVKVTAVTPAKTPTLDSLRPQLVAQAQSDMATARIYDLVQKYEDAHGKGATLDEAAKASGGTPVSLGPVSQTGLDMRGQPIAGLSPAVLKAAFALAGGGETEMQQDGPGEYFAIRVDKVLPPSVPTLDEIRAPLTQFWMSREMSKRLNEKAEALAAQIRKGESLEAAAAEAHVQIGHAVGVTRLQAMQNQQLGQELAFHLFAAKQGEIVTGQTSQMPVMVARVDTIAPPTPAQAAQMIAFRRQKGTISLFNAVGELMRSAAKAAVKPNADLDRARSAIGVSPDDLPKTASSAPAKKPAA